MKKTVFFYSEDFRDCIDSENLVYPVQLIEGFEEESDPEPEPEPEPDPMNVIIEVWNGDNFIKAYQTKEFVKAIQSMLPDCQIIVKPF